MSFGKLNNLEQGVGDMEQKGITKQSAVLQIVLAFFAISVLSGLIGEIATNGQQFGGIGIVGLLIWLYLANRIWSHTDPAKLEKFKNQKPINTWFIIAMVPLLILVAYMAWTAFSSR